MSFGAPEWLWGLLAASILVVLFARAEKRATERLREFVSPRLLPQLAATVDRSRRVLRFALQLLGLIFAIVALAQPRWGYTFQSVQRKGLDLLIAVDTSRSMLSNDVQPNRLERVKLAAQDLIDESQGDRIGLIAFAGRAFLQAPLTIDYDAVIESINDLDTKTIPEGGTNISEAIALAARTFGKSATGNCAVILFTDGEELTGDAVKAAKDAADAGVRIFTIGVGTPQGSLIPVNDDNGGTSFVKDSRGQVVKSKLDENRLREIAQATGGMYFHLESGPRTTHELFSEGLAKMKAAEMDVRLSRRPIERYEWPLGAGLIALALSILLGERKRVRVSAPSLFPQPAKIAAPAVAAVMLIFCALAKGAVPGVDLYQAGKFPEAYNSFEEDLKNHPDSGVRDKMQFDAGTAAYKMRDYNKALESFSGALLSVDKGLQERSHYNIGRTLEERADMDKGDEESLKDLEDAESHYEEALKLKPDDEAAKANLEEVKKKIERLKKRRKETPTPPPRSPQQKKDKDQQSSDQKNKQNQSSQQNQQQQEQQQSQDQSQSQQQSQSARSQKSQQQQNQSLAKNEQQKNQQQQSGQAPSPSPSPGQEKSNAQDRQSQPGESPTPSTGGAQMPSPSPGEGEDENKAPSAAPAGTPSRKLAGEIKGSSGESKKPPEQNAQLAQAESDNEDQMTEQQAEQLLQSTKDEEAHVQLDERRATRRVYNDW
jgi:Ca-activated chloride channel family protein